MSDTTGSDQDHSNDREGEQKAGGLGQDGTIRPGEDGVAAGMGDEDSNFNAEEDPGTDSH